jgi:ATP-dependent 26S proteasome regulatory subunit
LPSLIFDITFCRNFAVHNLSLMSTDADNISLVRLLREELGLLQQPGSYVGEVVKVMGSKRVLVKVHPEGKYGMV